MRFSRLHLENWRNFTHVDIALQQRMFLIGANATGKSNLLDVFRFLRDLVRIRGGFEEAILDRGGVAHLRSLAAHDRPDVVVEVRIADDDRELWGYRLAFGEDEQGRPLLKEEKVWKAGVLLLNRPDEQDASDKELLRETQLEHSRTNRAFRDVADFFSSVRYHHIVPQLVRDPERSIGRQADPYGGDFLSQIMNSPKELLQSRLERIQDVLRAAAPQLRHLQLDVGTDERGFSHFFARYGDSQLSIPWQTEVDFSDGTLRLIGLLWSLLEDGGPLLLEEPELSLHPGVVRYIPGIMVVLQRETHRQILVSTHSYDLLRNEGIAPDEVLILSHTPNGTKVELGFEIDVVRHLMDAGLTVAEAALPSTDPPHAGELTYFGA